MVATAVVLLALAGAIAFVMRMDEDPSQWLGSQPSRTAGRHVRNDALAPAEATAQEGGTHS